MSPLSSGQRSRFPSDVRFWSSPKLLILRLAFVSLLAMLAVPGLAQTPSLADVSRQIAQAEIDIRDVDRVLDTAVDADDRASLRAKALAAQQAARTSGGSLEDQLALITARVEGLGPAPEGTTEAPEIRSERRRLAQSHAAIDAAIKRSRLVDVEAQQLLDEIDRSRAEQLNQTLSTRIHSPLMPDFWVTVVKAIPRDLRRINLFASQGASQIRERWSEGAPWPALLGLVVAGLLLFPIRIRARQLGQRYLIGTTPGHRVRRSGFALWRLLVGTVTPTLAALVLVQGARWGRVLPGRWDILLDGFVLATGLAAFTAAVAGALLMRREGSWRVAAISDETATRLRPLSWFLAGIAFASVLVDAFNDAVGASQAAQAGAQVIEALLHLAWVGSFLLVLARLRAGRAARAEAAAAEMPAEQPAGMGLGALALAAWLLVGIAVAGLAIGYVSLSLFMARLIIWAILVGAALYLMMNGADDLAVTVFNRESRVGHTLVRNVGVRPSLVDQFGVLLSFTLRLLLVLIAIGLLMTPFGGGGGLASLFGRLGTFAQGVELGGIAISPGAIVRSIVVLVVALAIVRAFMGWLDNRYLPATDLDGSGRNSVSLVARYLGIALAILWALASLGIGIERIALLLSALSVGIGFGLQAITQNFVSGLILLAERPIKIGDWIRVGTDEGDVKRISVRSTEITLPDHSTLIVPNSELITKSVLNKTLSSPLGRIQIQFSVLLGTDAQKVLDIVTNAFTNEATVLDDPAPAAFIDAIADGRILFNCFAHVPSPRDAYKARSNILRELLTRFREEDIDIGTVRQRLELAPADQTQFEVQMPQARAKDGEPASSKSSASAPEPERP